MERKFYILFCPLVLFFSCTTPPPSINTTGTIASSVITQQITVDDSLPKILYVFFEIEKGNPKPIIKIQDKKITNGFIKSEILDQRREPATSYFKIDLLASDNTTVKSFLIDNPLTPIMETYTPEGIGKEKASFDKSEFSIRFNQNIDIKITNVNIYEINEQVSKLIFTQKL